MASVYAIDDSKPLADVLLQAVAQAGLSIDDEPVERAKRLLAQQLFVNAYTMRFKRQRTGDWDWLQKEPFLIPMCLADLIGHCLDQKLVSDCDANNGVTTNLPCNAALKILLGDANAPDSAAAAASAAINNPDNTTLFSPGYSASAHSVDQTPTLSAIRLGQLDCGDEPIDFARNLSLLEDDPEVAEKRSGSGSPRIRPNATKSRNHSNKSSRLARWGKVSNRQPTPRPPAPPEPSPQRSPHPSQPERQQSSPVKVSKKEAQAIAENNRTQRRSIRESALVKAMMTMLERITDVRPFHIDMIRAMPQCPDDQSSSDSHRSDNSGSEIDDEGRRRARRRTRTGSKDDVFVNGRDHSTSKGREWDRHQYGNGISPKRKRISYSSDR